MFPIYESTKYPIEIAFDDFSLNALYTSGKETIANAIAPIPPRVVNRDSINFLKN